VSGAPWWEDAVVYQIYPRSFCDTNGDGIGDLEGIRRHVGYLRDLGVDAVWLSPFYPSPMADFGYDVADYCDVDPLFGTLADFDRLVAELHAASLRVLIDWVPNHTSERHPWFVESRSSPSNPRRDWYLWRDDRPDEAGGSGPPGSSGRRPNNWLSSFAGVGRREFPPAWTWDEATGQWYLHLFLDQQPDLNWQNPEVREAMADTLRFWLERGVDGFRVDAVHTLGKDPALPDRDGSVATLPASASNDRPETHEFLAELRRAVDEHGVQWAPAGPGTAGAGTAGRGAGAPTLRRTRAGGWGAGRGPRAGISSETGGGRPLLVGEVFLLSTAQVAPYYGTRERPELDLAFNFEPLFAPWDAAVWHRRIARTESLIGPVGWPTWVLSNHDLPRHRSRYGGTEGRARAAAVMLCTLRGTPFLYAGEELGLEDAEVEADARVDPGGRDGCRAPLPWTPEPDHGWGDTSNRVTAGRAGGTATKSAGEAVQPWLPWPPGASTDRNVATQQADPGSTLQLYRRLLAARRRSPALRRGTWEPLGAPPGVLAYRRRHEGPGGEADVRVVVINFTDEPQPFPTGELEGVSWRVELSSSGDGSDESANPPTRLRPDEALILVPVVPDPTGAPVGSPT
jgi:alpha-glucosidase